MSFLRKQQADRLHEAKIRADEQARLDMHEAFRQEQLNPHIKLVRQMVELRQRIEQLELETARLRHLQERGRDA